MKRFLVALLAGALLSGPVLADGMQASEREVPQRVIEETAGASTQHLVLPAILAFGLFTAYMLATKADG